MIAIRKSWWAALALAAFVGCGKDETTPTNTPPATPSTPEAMPEPSPPLAPATKPESKPEVKPENPPAGPPAVEGPKVEAPKPTAPKADEKTDGDKTESDQKADAGTLSADEVAEIKKLPAGEQELALKQLICPVSDENLGSMGTPVKVSAGGKTFFLCCKGCQKEVNQDPRAVVAKLKN